MNDKQKKYRKLLMLVSFLCILFLNGCGQKQKFKEDTDKIAAEREEKIVVGVTLPSELTDYQNILGKLMEEEDEKDDSLKLDIQYAGNDVETQIHQIRDFIEKGVDSIILCPVNAKSYLNVLKEAYKAEIPVINLNMKVDMVSSEYIATYVGTSSSEEADLAAQMVVDYFDGREGKVGIIEGNSGTDPQIYRTQTFLEHLASHPNIQVVGIVEAGWMQSKASLAALDLIHKNEDIEIIYCHDSNMALGAGDRIKLEGLEGKIQTIGIGDVKEYRKEIENGSLYGIINQAPEFEAIYAISCAKRAAKGEELRSWYKNPVAIVTKENIDQYEK